MHTKLYAIEGMSCEHCVDNVTKALMSFPEVIDARVLLDSGQAVVRVQRPIPIDQINAMLQKAGGYTALESNESTIKKAGEEKKKKSFFQFLKREKPCCQ